MTKMFMLGFVVAILGVGVTVYADDQVDCSHRGRIGGVQLQVRRELRARVTVAGDEGDVGTGRQVQIGHG
jgi:hypothetical protein